MDNENFLGFNNFIWFVGVVEDRNDPQKLGRVRVRVLGSHVGDKVQLPTEDLPWAQVVHPVTSSGISGLGHTTFLVHGTWVFGYFRDGTDRQEPLILGTMPGKVSELGNPDKGFYDPDRREPKDIFNKDYRISVYPKDTEVDTNRLAVNDTTKEHSSLTTRKEQRITGVPTAEFDEHTAADGSTIALSAGSTFNQPEIPYKAEYPFNKVFESEAGHVKEYDDTTGAERIHERHTTGTGYEVDASGNKVDIIKGSHFELVSTDKQVFIDGHHDITIDGRLKVFVNKEQGSNNYDIEVGSGANVNIQVNKGDVNVVTVDGKINLNSGTDMNIKCGGNFELTCEGTYKETIEGSKTSDVTGAVIHRGQTIDLNP